VAFRDFPHKQYLYPVRFVTANKLFNGQVFLPQNSILVLDDKNNLHDIINEGVIEKNRVEVLDGIIAPGFINTHCHLELSHLKHKIPQHTGLPRFGRQVMSLRNTFSREEILEHMKEASHEMWSNGTVAVGDISNGSDSFLEKANSKLVYYTFIEVIGLNPKNANVLFDKGLELIQQLTHYNLAGSLAPHAPYSTSIELIKKIADYNAANNQSFSIHNQESDEETKFFKGEKSDFDELYDFLGIDISWFNPPKTSSLESYISFLSVLPSILVHNSFTQASDVALTQTKNVYWCFCPKANQYIENRLPDFTFFKEQKNRICFGTDSLASNTQLNLIDEVNVVLDNTHLFSINDALRGLTYNASQALGISEQFGSFVIGKNAGLNLVREANQQLKFIKKIA
jgi:aminodeoxyfutalosine deaminase